MAQKPSAKRPIWLAVSTHPEEYDLLFAAHDILKAQDPASLLVIAPRHPKPSRAWAPNRFAPVFFSDGGQPIDATGLFVMDAFGYLPRLHQLSHVSFIGGSLGKRGGHSPWEAASAGSYILTGPDIANNAPAYLGLEHRIVQTPEALADAVLEAWACAPACTSLARRQEQQDRARRDGAIEGQTIMGTWFNVALAAKLATGSRRTELHALLAAKPPPAQSPRIIVATPHRFVSLPKLLKPNAAIDAMLRTFCATLDVAAKQGLTARLDLSDRPNLNHVPALYLSHHTIKNPGIRGPAGQGRARYAFQSGGSAGAHLA